MVFLEIFIALGDNVDFFHSIKGIFRRIKRLSGGITMILSQGDVQYARDHGVVKLGEDVRNVFKANFKNSLIIHNLIDPSNGR